MRDSRPSHRLRVRRLYSAPAPAYCELGPRESGVETLTGPLPFDPSRIRRPEPADAAPPGPTLLSVRQVNELVRGVLARGLPTTLHVLGEIGDLSRPGSGHLYFTLKDAASELRCVMWRSTAHRLKFRPDPGMEVIATGTLEVYTPRGTYQLIVRKLEPRGVGALEVAFRQLRERLEREGLFDARRKKPLPRVPRRVAVVTSPTGAAIRDVLHTLARRFPVADVLVYPVRVQGEGAAAEIAAAIAALNTHADALGGIDVMIVGRGGGSLEDLWAFNEEVVARAIAASRIPVVSAVGHEVDVSISDLAADVRAPTPTAAAELVTPLLPELQAGIQRQRDRVARATAQCIALARARLQTLLAFEGLARPLAAIRQSSQLLDDIQNRLRLLLVERFRRAAERLNAAELALWRFGTGARFAQAGRAVDQRLARLWRAAAERLWAAERRVNQLQGRAERLGPVANLPSRRDYVGQAVARLTGSLRGLIERRRCVLAGRVQAVATFDPRQVLKRGYSITRLAPTGRVVRSVQGISGGVKIVTEVSDGEFHSVVQDPRQPTLFDRPASP